MKGLYALAAVSLVGLAACSGEPPVGGGPAVEVEPPDNTDTSDEPQHALTLMEALGSFGSCMRLEMWVRTGVYNLYEAQTNNGDTCTSCHADGATGGMLLSVNIVDTFDDHTKFPAIMRLVTGTTDKRGNFSDLVPSNRYMAKGVESCPPEESGLVCHPDYDLLPEYADAVTTFVSETLDRWHNDSCDVPLE